MDGNSNLYKHAGGTTWRQQTGEAGVCRGMSESSEGVRNTLELMLHYQSRTEALLGHLLGRTYTLGDAAFYLGGASLSLASGLHPRTRPARSAPVLLLPPCAHVHTCAWVLVGMCLCTRDWLGGSGGWYVSVCVRVAGWFGGVVCVCVRVRRGSVCT